MSDPTATKPPAMPPSLRERIKRRDARNPNAHRHHRDEMLRIRHLMAHQRCKTQHGQTQHGQIEQRQRKGMAIDTLFDQGAEAAAERSKTSDLPNLLSASAVVGESTPPQSRATSLGAAEVQDSSRAIAPQQNSSQTSSYTPPGSPAGHTFSPTQSLFVNARDSTTTPQPISTTAAASRISPQLTEASMDLSADEASPDTPMFDADPEVAWVTRSPHTTEPTQVKVPNSKKPFSPANAFQPNPVIQGIPNRSRSQSTSPQAVEVARMIPPSPDKPTHSQVKDRAALPHPATANRENSTVAQSQMAAPASPPTASQVNWNSLVTQPLSNFRSSLQLKMTANQAPESPITTTPASSNSWNAINRPYDAEATQSQTATSPQSPTEVRAIGQPRTVQPPPRRTSLQSTVTHTQEQPAAPVRSAAAVQAPPTAWSPTTPALSEAPPTARSPTTPASSGATQMRRPSSTGQRAQDGALITPAEPARPAHRVPTAPAAMLRRGSGPQSRDGHFPVGPVRPPRADGPDPRGSQYGRSVLDCGELGPRGQGIDSSGPLPPRQRSEHWSDCWSDSTRRSESDYRRQEPPPQTPTWPSRGSENRIREPTRTIDTNRDVSNARTISPTTVMSPRRESNSSNGHTYRVTHSNQQNQPSPINAEDQVTTPGNFTEPPWSKDRSRNKQPKNRRNTGNNQVQVALSSLKDSIRYCENENVPGRLARHFDALRDQIHKAEFLHVNEPVLCQTFMLGATGLTRIFQNPKCNFPWDVRADAFQLCMRWSLRIFEIDLLRGIDQPGRAVGKTGASGYRINKAWREEHPMSAQVFGNNNLINGQWWPHQICTVRDGAHGSIQGGIYGTRDIGAYSVVASGASKYKDEDAGDWLWYRGTDGKDESPTENTKLMVKSKETGKPVRLIRSFNLPQSNPHRPAGGYRYDGLYQVVEYRIKDQQNAIYEFRLVRCPGQDPIRSGTGPQARPTKYELEQYNKLKEKW